MRTVQILAPAFFILAAACAVAAPAAPSVPTSVPRPIEIREARGAGLLLRVWLQGRGPFTFALDTGAGCNIVTSRTALAANLEALSATVPVQGVSGSKIVAHTAEAATFAAGSRDNVLPSTSTLLVADTLPDGVDGLIDPSIVLWPLGFEIDMQRGTLTAFDPLRSPIDGARVPEGGGVVRWDAVDETRRPWVKVGPGRFALVDTGSQLGFAVGSRDAERFGVIALHAGDAERAVDSGGGVFRTRRATTPTLHVGSMELRNVPTNIVESGDAHAPILLGREALRPFAIAFDPRARLIRFAPYQRDEPVSE